MTNEQIMSLVSEFENVAKLQRKQASYKRFAAGVKTRKRGIAKGLEMAALRLRAFVIPSEPFLSDRDIEIAEHNHND